MKQPQQANMMTAQPQPVVALATQQPPAIPSSRTPESTQRFLNIIRGLAISQLAMGSLSILIEIVLIGLASRRYGYGRTNGVGIWCGAWVIVAGTIGFLASRQVSNRCLIRRLLYFSIVGAVFSAIHFILSISSTFGHGSPNAFGQPQNAYVTANQQQPLIVQQPGVSGAQGYVIQSHQPVSQMVQYPGIPIQQQMAPVATQHPAHTKVQDALAFQTGQPNYPPAKSPFLFCVL